MFRGHARTHKIVRPRHSRDQRHNRRQHQLHEARNEPYQLRIFGRSIGRISPPCSRSRNAADILFGGKYTTSYVIFQ